MVIAQLNAEAENPILATSAETVAQTNHALVDSLVAAGCLSKLDRHRIDHVLANDKSGQTLPVLLVDYGLVGASDLAESLAALVQVEICRLTAESQNLPAAAKTLSLRFLEEHCVLPVASQSGSISLAMGEPRDDYAAKAVSLATGCRIIRMVADISEIRATLEGIRTAEALANGDGDDESNPVESGSLSDADVHQLRDLATGAPAIRLVNDIIANASSLGASDIHVEPQRDGTRVRFRVDGELTGADAHPDPLLAAAVPRIKIMANLDIAERRLPQDGRCQQKVGGVDYDLRVATLPTMYGEGVVIRLLNQTDTLRDLSALGLSDGNAGIFRKALADPNGMLLLTGPTGSGKTTTLYAALSHLNDGRRKIITIEDPVEYQLAGISQIPTKPSIGLTFARALRSVVRQDPDIIMVGEMRDTETARISVQSSLTGHLVLSTLHTNNAVDSILRLRDMGIEDYLLATTLRIVVAQRLVRKLCVNCREPFAPTGNLARELPDVRRMYRAVGCPECSNGYRGRIAIHECLYFDESLRDLVARGAGSAELRQCAGDGGMLTLRRDGFEKAAAGLTTPEEIARVIED